MAEPQWVESHELAPPPPETAPLWVEGHELQPQAQPADEGPSGLEAAARGAGQGFTFGLGDEVNGFIQAVGDKVRGDSPNASFGELYRRERGTFRREDAAAKAAHPGYFTGGELAGSIPTSFLPGLSAGKGASVLSTVARGGLSGGLMGLGNSNADLTQGEYARAALDTGVGAGTGAALGYAGAKLGKFGQKASDEVRLANADAAQVASQKLQKASLSATGAYGGEVAGVLNKAKSLEHALQSPLASAEQKAAAQAQLASPEFQELYRNALQGNLDLSAQQMGGRLLNSKAAMETARASNTPQGVEALAAQAMEKPFRKQVLPRLLMYGERLVPAALGMHMGGVPGAIAGTAMGLVMGKPGTALANMVKNPGFRAGLWGALGAGSNALTPVAQHAIPGATQQLSPDIAARIAALRQRPELDTSQWTPDGVTP